MASRFFTLAVVFIVIAGLEFQSARTAMRLNLLEQEIEALRHRPALTVQPGDGANRKPFKQPLLTMERTVDPTQ